MTGAPPDGQGDAPPPDGAADDRTASGRPIDRIDRAGERILDTTVRVSRTAGRIVFGDRVGLALWLGLVVALALTWQIGFFLTDTYTIVNTLLNLADGRLAVTEMRYLLSLGSQPGLHEHAGRLYGRNYGQVAAAVPLVWLLRGLSAVVPLRLLIAGGFSFGILAFARQTGRIVDRRRAAGAAGATLALVAFLLNFRLATSLERALLPLVALQLSTLLFAGLVGVLLYRIVALFHDRRVAVTAGAIGGLATPVGFWATIPKRHVLVATLLLASVYSFARSRQTGGRRQVWLRGLAYGFVGLIAWIHAFEGFFALVALAPVDLATAESNDRRQLAVVLLVLLAGLTPMFVTNTLISGDPVTPPRLLPEVGLGDVEFTPGEGDGPGSGTSGDAAGKQNGTGRGDTTPSPSEKTATATASETSPSSTAPGDSTPTPGGQPAGDTPKPEATPETSSSGTPTPTASGGSDLPSPLPSAFSKVMPVLALIAETFWGGISVLSDPDRVFRIFVRSGGMTDLWWFGTNEYEAIELTVLESAPILAGLLAVPIAAFRAFRRRLSEFAPSSIRRPSLSPVRQTDLLVASYGVVLTFVYLYLLPLTGQITVRYLLPSMVLGVYGVLRLRAVRVPVARRDRWFAGSWSVATVGWLVVSPSLLSVWNVALGEAMQFHALVNLGTAALLAITTVGHQIAPRRVRKRHVALAVGVAAGATTAFVLLARIEFFSYGSPALGTVRVLERLILVF